MTSKRNIRIGNVSGATGDAPHAMLRMAETGNVDVIVGDWLSEMNIAWNAITMAQDPSLGYENGFYTQLEESLDAIVSKNVKVVTNAGALNTEALKEKVQNLCDSRGYGNVTIAAVLGDDVTKQVVESLRAGEKLYHHLDHGDNFLNDWDEDLQPTTAAAYIGAWGIVEALQNGADIVLCGRVTDASPVIGAAAWWFGWSREAFDQLAGALIAGHLIECGPYATGANFSGFKQYLEGLVDLGFPIAEIQPSGACYITKPQGSAGIVNKFNITAQLLYELQGEMYLNSDVVADIRTVEISDTTTPNRVYVSGVKGSPPPPTTKVMVAAPGGYQAETTYYINGLDISEKALMMKRQLEHIFRGNKFSKFSVELYGTQAVNPRSQAAGTVMLRVFAQARRKEDIEAAMFRVPIYSLRMQSYPGYHMNLDFRTMDPKQFMEIYPTTISQDLIDHRIILGNQKVMIPPPSKTTEYSQVRPSYETATPVDLSSFGPVLSAPLGSIVHARSGDKANNSNVGFFVRHHDEYSWLQSLLTVTKIKELLGDDWTENANNTIERCEFPKILAVHFRILDFLDGGIASSSRIDGLGKGVGEYLRSKHVDVPEKFLSRGWI